jgi:hypothetical protein
LPWDGSQTPEPAHEAVFSGSLVNLKNVATHKSVALTIEVPEEYAAALIAAFGWPTRVRPVAVAIAKLAGEVEPTARGEQKAKEHWADMAPSKQAALLCKEPDFQEFACAPGSEHGTAMIVRDWCEVASRKFITPGNPAGHRWNDVMIEYGAWLRRKRG